MPAPSKPDPIADPSLSAFWQKHGSKILLVFAAAALVFAGFRYKRTQDANKVIEVQAALSRAWGGVQQVQAMSYSTLPVTPEQAAARSAVEIDVNQAVQTVLDEADASDTVRLASASLARGELYWALAHAPVAAPSTQPTTQSVLTPASQPAKDYLALAQTAYAKIVSDYSTQTEALTLARFGLAAVAEDRRVIADARTQYQALLDNSTVSGPDKAMAAARLSGLNQLEKPLLLLPATQPVTAPAVSLKTDFPMMSMGTPATQPATKP